jgi:hypothetical protein
MKKKDILKNKNDLQIWKEKLAFQTIVYAFIFCIFLTAAGYTYELFFKRFESSFFKEGIREFKNWTYFLLGTLSNMAMNKVFNNSNKKEEKEN